jgi:hypothetical protein
MNTSSTSRRRFRRRSVQVEVSIRLRPPETILKSKSDSGVTLVGRTRNLSETGIALVVSANNIDRYLRYAGSTFHLELKLPNGSVGFDAAPVYYKRYSAGGVINYLIGSHFANPDPEQLATLKRFLHSLPVA